MKTKNMLLQILLFTLPAVSQAQEAKNIIEIKNNSGWHYFVVIVLASFFVLYISLLSKKFRKLTSEQNDWLKKKPSERYKTYTKELSADQLETLIEYKEEEKKRKLPDNKTLILVFLLSIASGAHSNTGESVNGGNITSQPGIIITLILILIPVFLGSLFAIYKAIQAFKIHTNSTKFTEAKEFAQYLRDKDDTTKEELNRRKESLTYKLSDNELTGKNKAYDEKGLIISKDDNEHFHFTAPKKKIMPKPTPDPAISKLITWYIGCAAFWLALGGLIGEYVGIKFVSPDADHVSWLSFGRLRPVHTNMVFWGWASLGIIGLGYYVVTTVSNTKIYSLKWGWASLWLINCMVIFGSISLMAGVNNGGGEFREYIWPITLLFGIALILTAANFIKTVAKRETKEIYISNWYIISSILFTIVIALTAYLPFWQNGIGETIIQGYYMHSGVGMWFTLYTLGLLYYFVPQQLNKPIYSYSLGILAFWTQILFYTIIGTHHFVFSALPWWLQTVAIVGSAGMIIPVTAATINYYMTFKGQWKKISKSYTLPFFFVAVMYYFIVSMQGTAEAFKFTNLLWHFTDFTVGHSHLGFYGIISFAIWGGVYTVMPRLTGNEPPQHLIGAHFWLSFCGLLFYAIPLSIGGTLKGMMWMEHKPFIDSVVMMFDFWLWRAIGGSLMFVSHFVFAYNFYKMIKKKTAVVDIKEEALKQLKTLTRI